ncbi:MAG: ATP-binding cassette domain-containing protein [Bacteroidales bacterium]
MLHSIEANHLVKQYGRQRALQGISFSATPGTITALVGPNGAGKSTLLKLLAGILLPTSGTAKVGGFDIGSQSVRVRSVVGYLSESNPLYPDMYVEEFLLFCARVHGLGREAVSRVGECISLTGLAPELHKQVGQLSKGYRQRVGLARALIHNPAVLILDEPASGLDPNQLEEFRELIREVGRTRTVILSTHILHEAESLCNRILLLKEGSLVADESVTRFARRQVAATRRVRVEFDRSPDPQKIVAIEGVEQVSVARDGVLLVSGSGEIDFRPGLFQFAVEEGIIILSVQQIDDKIESIFRNLTANEHCSTL